MIARTMEQFHIIQTILVLLRLLIIKTSIQVYLDLRMNLE